MGALPDRARHRAAHGRSFTFPVYPERQGTGAVAVRKLAVDVSHDEGRSWHTAKVKRSGVGWAVTVKQR